MLGVITRVPVTNNIMHRGEGNVHHSASGDRKYYYEETHIDYLGIRIWNCKDDMLDSGMYDVLKGILQNPCLVKEELMLSAMDLATLDVTKPVYLEKYNSYFAIKTIEVSSEGTSIAELLRIPSEII